MNGTQNDYFLENYIFNYISFVHIIILLYKKSHVPSKLAEVVKLLAHVQKVAGSISARTPTILTKICHGLFQSLQTNAVIVPCNRLQPLTSISFPIHHSTFDVNNLSY